MGVLKVVSLAAAVGVGGLAIANALPGNPASKAAEPVADPSDPNDLYAGTAAQRLTSQQSSAYYFNPTEDGNVQYVQDLDFYRAAHGGRPPDNLVSGPGDEVQRARTLRVYETGRAGSAADD